MPATARRLPRGVDLIALPPAALRRSARRGGMRRIRDRWARRIPTGTPVAESDCSGERGGGAGQCAEQAGVSAHDACRSAGCPRGSPPRAGPRSSAASRRSRRARRIHVRGAARARTPRPSHCASRSVVSMYSGSVAQMNSPPCGFVHLALRAEVLRERLQHHVAPAPVEVLQLSRYPRQSCSREVGSPRTAASSARSRGRRPVCRG